MRGTFALFTLILGLRVLGLHVQVLVVALVAELFIVEETMEYKSQIVIVQEPNPLQLLLALVNM
jgi:hypothetical protein